MTVLNCTFSDYYFNRMQHTPDVGESSEKTLATVTEQSTMSISSTSRRTSSRRTSSSSSGTDKTSKRPGKRPGRKPSKVDEHAKLERSRQSARECRARKKLRYQYLEELVLNREKAVFALRDELETFKQWCLQMDTHGTVPEGLVKLLARESTDLQQKQMKDSHRALQQQQRITQRPTSSSSSSSSQSSNNGSPPQQQQQQQQPDQQHLHQKRLHLQQQQQQQQQQQSAAPQRPGGFPQKLNLPNLSPTLSIGSPVSVSRSPVTQPPPLRRQMAVDVPPSNPHPHHHHHQQQQQQLTPIQHHLRSRQQSHTTSSQQQPTQRGMVESPHGQASSLPVNKQPVSPAHLRPTLFQQRSPAHPLPGPSHLHQHHIPQFTRTGCSHEAAAASPQSQPSPQGSSSSSSGGGSSSIPRHLLPSSSFPTNVSQGQTLPRVKSEPPLQYSQSLDNVHSASTSSTVASIPYGAPNSVGAPGHFNEMAVSSRVRSASNPSSMMAGSKMQSASGDQTLGSYTNTFSETTQLLPHQRRIDASRVTFPFDNSSIPFVNMSATAPVEDTIPITEEESLVPDNFLFVSHGMTGSHGGKAATRAAINKQFRQSRSAPFPISSDGLGLEGVRNVGVSRASSAAASSSGAVYDPHATLSNLTTVHCFSATRTSNTPSPAPYGLIPVGGGGFKPVGVTSTTPSSSSETSPAPPLSSVSSSFQEISSAAAESVFAAQDKQIGLSQAGHQSQDASSSSYPATAAVHQSQAASYHQVPFTSQPITEQQCSSGTGLGSLSASISEPLEELYSYLKDLQEGSLPLEAGQATSSGVKPSGDASNVMSNDPSLLNLPTIIDDLLSREGSDSNMQ